MGHGSLILHTLQGVFLVLLLLATGLEALLTYWFDPVVGQWLVRVLSLILIGLFLLRVALLRVQGWMRLLPFAGCVLWLGLPMLYFYNASHVWQAGVGLLPVSYQSYLPAAAYPLGAQRAIWLAVAVAGVLGVSVQQRTKWREAFMVVWVLCASVLAVWVLCQRSIPRAYPIYEWTGWFVSRNHFAAFACLVFPVAIAIGARMQRRAITAGKLSSPAILFYLSAGILAWAIIQTGSRAGAGILALQALGLCVWFGCRVRADRQMELDALRLVPGEHVDRFDADGYDLRFGGVAFPRCSWHFLLRLILVVAGLGMALWMFFLFYHGGFGRIGNDLYFRLQVVRDTWRMWFENRWWGTGPQSFVVVFPYYQSELLQGYFFYHAHNDPMQILSEWGALGVGVLVLGAWLILYARHDAAKAYPIAFGCFRMERFALGLALAGVLLHSLVDFPLQHPHILLLACVWLGMAVRLKQPSNAGQ